MIIILEGLNGVGKSTYATAISERIEAPIVRPFRPSPDTHWNSGLEGHEDPDDNAATHLAAAGVPINTFVDDLYVADLIRTLNPPNAVLDRGMPSSVAYGRLKGEAWLSTGAVDWVVQYWERCLIEVGKRSGQSVALAYLTAGYQEARHRCGDRWHPNKGDWEKLKRTYEKVIHRSALPVISVNTETCDVASGVDKILAYANP